MSENALTVPDSAVNVLSIPRSFFLLTEEQFRRIQFMAKMYATSSFNAGDDKKTEGDYFIIMIKGVELGLSLTAAVEFISVIKGKPCVDGKGMLALIRNSPKCKSVVIDSQDAFCTVTGERADTGDSHTETWTMDDARKFMVYEKGSLKPLADRHQWKSQPKTMLKWRAVAAFARALYSDVIGGLYSKEEMLEGEAIVTDSGEMTALSQPSSTSQPSSIPAVPTHWSQDAVKVAWLVKDSVEKGYLEANQAEKDLLHLLGKDDFLSFPTCKEHAVPAVKAAAEALQKQAEPAEKIVTVTKAVHGKFIVFPEAQATWFKGRKELAAATGAAFAEAARILAWDGTEKAPKPFEFPALTLTLRKPEGKPNFEIVKVEPVAADPGLSEEPPLPELSDAELDALMAEAAATAADPNDIDLFFSQAGSPLQTT